MKIILATLTATALALPAMAQEGRELAEISFTSVDANQDGFVDMGESSQYGGDVFFSMDSDESGSLSEEEFLSWGYGFQNLAEDTDKDLAYRTALRVVFSFWDRDGNGEVSATEHRQSINRDFERADLDGDALLSQSEFLGGFAIMKAIGVALKPTL